MTYEKALEMAKKNPNFLYTYDAGGGFRGETFYCPCRNRYIHSLVNSDGIRF